MLLFYKEYQVTKQEANALPPERRLEYFGSRLVTYLALIARGAKLEFPNANRCRKWGVKVAHAAYELHPEIRPEGNLEKYLEGRLRGLRGVPLSRFINDPVQGSDIERHR